MNNHELITKIEKEILCECLDYFNVKLNLECFDINAFNKEETYDDINNKKNLIGSYNLYVQYFKNKIDLLMYKKHRKLEDFIKIKICKEKIEFLTNILNKKINN